MADGIKLPQLDPTTGLDNSDVMLTTKGSQDYKATLAELVSHIKDNITPTEILAMLLQVDGDNAGINATTLQGLLPSFFRNASNLNSGTVPNSRLPNGVKTSSFTAGGSYPAEGRRQHTFDVPEHIFGERIRIVIGHTFYTPSDRYITVNFDQPFTSGLDFLQNAPTVICSAQCIRDNGSGGIPDGRASTEVEIEVKLWSANLSKMEFATFRENGNGPDTARANYIAWGRY